MKTSTWLIRPPALAVVALIGCAGSGCTGEHERDGEVQSATSPACVAQAPTEQVTLNRWNVTGGLDGPLGCVVTPTQPVLGGNGQVIGQTTQFQHGQIVTSPAQGGGNMAVAVYQKDADLYVDWGDTGNGGAQGFNYDLFQIRWDINGVNAGQQDAPTPDVIWQAPTSYYTPHPHRTRGVFAIPLPQAATYTIALQGCDLHSVSFGSYEHVCNQGWTVPATITYVPPPPPPVSNDCNYPVPEPLYTHWLELGGLFGALGCPVSDATADPSQNNQLAVQTFQRGQMGWFPGQEMTVAAYQAQSDVVVQWWNRFGTSGWHNYHYSKYNVLWNKDGIPIPPQHEIRQPVADAGPFNHGIDNVRGVGPGAYTVAVEGCDDGTTSSTCRQGFTPSLTVNVTVPPYYYASCPLVPNVPQVPSGIIGERWSRMMGPNGSLLGCPTGPEVSVQNGKSQTFERGQIVWSPSQGQDMTVVLYQLGDTLYVAAGDTFPYNYDTFQIIWNHGATVDVTDGSRTSLSGLSYSQNMVNTSYTAQIQGCDLDITGAHTCKQGWTIPVSFTFATPNKNDPNLNGPPPIDFTTLTAATTPAQAAATLSSRALAISTRNGCVKTLGDVFKDEQDFANGALAKLDLVSRNVTSCSAPYERPLPIRDEVNAALRFQQIKSNTGSTADKTLLGCTRQGEYDVALTGYIPMVYRYGAYLDNDVRAHIVNDLLNAHGARPNDELSYCNNVPETENHLNGIESARYLTNQLLYQASGNQWFNNEVNGMNDEVLEMLQAFLKRDFLEYNSKPYQTYTANAIQNLYDFATDRRVKLAAQLVLDYIAAKYAVSSNTLRKNAPFRRRPSLYQDDLFGQHADPWSVRMAMTTGMVTKVPVGYPPPDFAPEFSFGWAVDLQMAAISSYQPPDLVVDFIMNPSRRSYYERMAHDGAGEIYAATPNYLITAGGVPEGSPYTVAGIGDPDDKGMSVGTTLMPTGADRSVTDLIRFDSGLMGNLCVAPNFACGANLRIPAAYLTDARKQLGPNGEPPCTVIVPQGAAPGTPPNPNGPNWVFIDSATARCNTDASGSLRPSAFYVAVFVDGPWVLATDGSLTGDRGFFEAHSYDHLSFAAFQAGVQQRNGGGTYFTTTPAPVNNSYVMTSGRTVTFTSVEPWLIVSTGDPTYDAIGNTWPLASGDAFSADGSGLVTFQNAGQQTSLTLDFRDVGEPKRTVVAPPPPPPPPQCRKGFHDCGDGVCIPNRILCQ